MNKRKNDGTKARWNKRTMERHEWTNKGKNDRTNDRRKERRNKPANKGINEQTKPTNKSRHKRTNKGMNTKERNVQRKQTATHQVLVLHCHRQRYQHHHHQQQQQQHPTFTMVVSAKSVQKHAKERFGFAKIAKKWSFASVLWHLFSLTFLDSSRRCWIVDVELELELELSLFLDWFFGVPRESHQPCTLWTTWHLDEYTDYFTLCGIDITGRTVENCGV